MGSLEKLFIFLSILKNKMTIKQKGSILLLALSAVTVLTLLFNSSISFLAQQNKININNQVTFMAITDCENAIQKTRLWLMDNATTPINPTNNGSSNIWENNTITSLPTEDTWWNIGINTLNAQSLSTMPDIGDVKITIEHKLGEGTDTFRTYEIISRCQTKKGDILSIQQASITIGFPTQNTLPVMDLKHYQ
ncbi:hypothetical protein MNB_SUP05-5-1136 [hydrothermal vent metagenome]|uniref:Uncharacterized protein n=1 Tax=hydrothermal vent metagenome TaxID=652676 RepID=A0A1W1CVT1_9ZZZZ